MVEVKRDLISKAKLIRSLENSIGLEEEGSKLIARVLMAKIEESSLSGDEKERLTEIMRIIKEDSTRHGKVIREVLEYVQRGGIDDFYGRH